MDDLDVRLKLATRAAVTQVRGIQLWKCSSSTRRRKNKKLPTNS